MANQVGWIGLGRMGEAMVKRLLKAGFGASVWNRTRSKAEPLAEYGADIAPDRIARSKDALDSAESITGNDDTIESLAADEDDNGEGDGEGDSGDL